MKHAVRLFNRLFASNLVLILMFALFIFKVFGMDADMFLNAVFGLSAIIAGAMFAFNSKISKGISIASFLVLLFFAHATTEPRLSDLVIMTVWFPYFAALAGAKAMSMFGNEEVQTDTVSEGTDS